MDMITTNTNTAPKSAEPESETPTRIQIQQPPTKPVSFSNGVLKRHHHHLATPTSAVSAAVTAATYKECLKNHAASLGGHALDGCGEFMPSPGFTAGDPTSIKCAACGCHRNFHRREPDEPPNPAAAAVVEYQPHHRHHPPPPPPFHSAAARSPSSASPPPISSSYYPSAPHMLLALSSGGLSVAPENTAAPSGHHHHHHHHNNNNNHPLTPTTTRKRFRTKFTQDQKEKMLRFAERVGWKMQKRDDEHVRDFCNEIGVDRGVLKVWMHNNKNTFGRRDSPPSLAAPSSVAPLGAVNGDGIHGNDESDRNNMNGGGGNEEEENNLADRDPSQYENDSVANVGTNGSSSSS